ncbi:lipid A ethanolaminephosphotransferase [Aeromonas sp. RU39B]|uniref:phosphoethanolamine transferase n=1 Tax=Aeromonas sp. RU39B TaxID=1907416 RepID=UPI000956E046|nr:phosphoethanolamine--lipid A transferase [Aeromonas sp. RU39B]SIQ65214.1 lipid A ethanolaminephosphotransferase [Aeromonas sp. RU39B]
MTSRLRIRVLPLVLLLALYFAIVFNWPLFLNFYAILSAQESINTGFAISIPLLLFAALVAVFIPFSFRWWLKPFFTLVLLSSSLVSYAMFKYHVVFDSNMVQNIFETNPGEARSYLNASVLLWFALTGLVPSALLWIIRVDYPARWHQSLLLRLGAMLLALLVAGGVLEVYDKQYLYIGRNHKVLAKEIVPSNYLFSAGKYLDKRYLSKPEPFVVQGADAKRVSKVSKPTLMFLVVGETARARNYASNGYGRDTNPFTAREGDVLAFLHVHSCGTETAVSVPCMFSNLGRAHFDDNKARNRYNLLDVLTRAGVSVYWKDNDGGCKDVCNRVPHHDLDPAAYPRFCHDGSCLDEALLEALPKEIDKMGENKLVVFHIMGSHGPNYYRRYPDAERYFTPDCQRNDIENCDNAVLINSYDNTIRYTDYVLAKMIDLLKQYQDRYDTALLYLSDHGESLGEKGLYLHGTPYMLAPEEQTHIPMQLWMSAGFATGRGINRGCMADEAKRTELSQDNLFSSLLGVWDVQTTLYQPALDLFKPCRQP